MKEQKNKMKRYLERVIRLFMDNDYSLKTVNDFHRWLSKEDNIEDKNEMLKEEWDKISVVRDSNTNTAFNNLLDKLGIEAKEDKVRHIRFRTWKYVAAAAVFSCVISTVATKFILDMNEPEMAMTECYVPYRETKEVTLPDGSKANLNSGSYILYRSGFEGDTRDIYLVGEAVFDVAKNKEKPFIVHSGEVSVTALGTKFNVKAYPEDNILRATLLEGKIKVGCGSSEDYYLKPGQQLSHNKETHKNEIKEVDADFVTAWQRGEIVLHQASLKEISIVLEKRYDIEFRLFGENKLAKDLFSFTFKEDATIEEVLEIMKIVLGNFDYKLKNNVCYVYWK